MRVWLALVVLLSAHLVCGSDGGGVGGGGFFRPPAPRRIRIEEQRKGPSNSTRLADGFGGGSGAGATGAVGPTGPPSHGLVGFNVLVPDGAGTSYAAPGFSGQISMPTAGVTTFESRAASLAPGITLTALRCSAGTAQGSGNTAVITLRSAATIAGLANSVVTCTMANALTCTSAASVTLVDPSYIDFSITLTGTSPVGGTYTCSAETA